MKSTMKLTHETGLFLTVFKTSKDIWNSEIGISMEIYDRGAIRESLLVEDSIRITSRVQDGIVDHNECLVVSLVMKRTP